MRAIFTIGNFYVDIVSIIIIIFMLVSIIGGCIKGFAFTLLNAGKVVIIFAAGVLLAKPISVLLTNSPIGAKMIDTLSSSFLAKGAPFDMVINDITDKGLVIQEGLKTLSIPEAFIPVLSKLLNGIIPDSGEEQLAIYFANSITSYAMLSLAFLIIELVVSIVVIVLGRLLKNINKIPLIGSFNRILGGVFGLFIAYIMVDALLFGLAFLSAYSPTLAEWVNTTLYLGETNEGIFTISKFMTTNSITNYLISLFIK